VFIFKPSVFVIRGSANCPVSKLYDAAALKEAAYNLRSARNDLL